MTIMRPLKDSQLFGGGPTHPVPSTAPISPVDYIGLTLHIADVNGTLVVSFENQTPAPGDGPLDMRIYHDSLVTLSLDTSNCDWEFDHTKALELGPPGTPGNNYVNLSPPLGSVPNFQRLVTISFEAKYLAIAKANSDPYVMNFIVYNHPGDFSTTGYPKPRYIDPDIKNPGNYGLLGPFSDTR